MIRFVNIQFFQLFWLIPLLAVFFWYAFRKKNEAILRFGSPELMEKLTAVTSRQRQRLKAAALIAGAAIMVAAIARPQIGTRIEEVTREGQDIIVAIDVSASMMAEDISPSRLEKAKHEIGEMIDKLEGDRIGLIAFAGEAFVQCPLTLDYGAAKLLLSVINPNLIPLPGTNVSQALIKAIETFEQQERKHKILILITDGEDHVGDIDQYAEAAAREGIVIYTVGIGTPEGVPIPEFDLAGNRIGFRKDSDGQTIVTKLDELTLEKIASTTGGKYFRATPEEAELDRIYAEISSGEKKELGSMQFTQFEDRFQYFLALFILILLFETILPERRKIKEEWKGRY
ncbi:VWA domain-containing protein [candidate division KSB1 bacterium]|nr:VWA domain-containing protein [candidate division KSB1 bacterium]